ncbi:MFS transporter [Streptomyces sp. NBC_00503]|uniref:MFS transporter n=1 Tax=Streptomyces sp. NBC_00503 TaxID=2903659 RepID=UPI002E81793B|nr:MFS transporter [Streptomyces sp. NBC_00503]WUD82392.1 MFS transporter [Streptomyces sp. NBC_00503]
MAVVRDLRVLLRLRDFRNLLAVRLLCQAADGVYQVALATYVVFSPEKQASPAAIASAMAVLLLPYSVIGPFAGVLLDRWPRRQVFLYGNLLRAFLACVTGMLIVAHVPDWLFYASALSVTAVNRFVLAGLAASLPRVVGPGELVTANALSPTAGTLAAVAGGGLAFLVRVLASDSDALVVLLAAGLYLCAALVSLGLAVGLLGPDHPPGGINPTVREGVALAVRGMADGLRHLSSRREAARALTAMTLMRFCYGALFVTLLMLCRYAWSDNESDGLALLGVTVGVSGAGFFAAAVVTPWLVGRLGTRGWMTACAAGSAVLVPALGLFFAPGPMLAAAFVLGLATQGAKISTDTVVQSRVDDAFRGRVFSVYDVLFNAAFVGAAAVAALVLPLDGQSVPLILGVATLYALTAAFLMRQGDVSRETSP